MDTKVITYSSFLNSNQIPYAGYVVNNASSLIEHFKPSQLSGSPFAPVTFLVDYATKKYLYVEESCFDLLGFKASYFLETGLEEYLNRWHKDDFQVMNSKVFPTNLAFLNTLPKDKFKEYVFSYNYRFQNAIGNYTTVLQRFSYIPNPIVSLPQGVVGVIFDITHFKRDKTIVSTIEKLRFTEQGKVTELISKNTYPITDIERPQLLSKREIEIVKLIGRGLSSKQIAAEKGLSIYTVNNHRKNILAKTASRSSAELINYAVNHGIV
ncbi:response regulator transcription factor [Flavisolibacter sp. BT320]|nr:response regulator transcription factor [Flavisolibacter longurius]